MLVNGDTFRSPGCGFEYKVIGAVCVLYDREKLPYPCCSLQWKGKEPSWNRIGKRFIPDVAYNNCATYAVTLFDYLNIQQIIYSFPYKKLNKEESQWWVTKLPKKKLKALKE
jgi:hypothetical protein